MPNTPAVDAFWQAYLATLPPGAPRPETFQVWYFGDGPEMADELAALVLQGKKTATASLLWSLQQPDEPFPEVGGLSMITDFAGSPLFIIETTQVYVVPFNAVDAEQAFLEGEGDRSLQYWRAGHWHFFSRECQVLGREPSEEMPVVCERFRMVYSSMTAGDGFPPPASPTFR